ncbi:MAG: Bd3614 family nucleic acid deaminase [Oligoflexia bacterium]|nr:Bd3614 family nucleic acid deaminase [Oligoflexia bacterium]
MTENSTDLALLTSSRGDQHTVYWSQAARQAPPFLSAPAVLIQGLYERETEMARKILRERIYTNAPMNEALRGLVKVCAKRIDVDVPKDVLQTRLSQDAIRIDPPPLPEIAEPGPGSPMAQARWLAQSVARGKAPLYASDRPIGAVLVSQQGELLAYGANTNARNRSCHAEMNLLRTLYARTGKPIPAGSTLYVTLKPCRMCAGMIWDFCEDARTIRVLYDENDPGPHAQRTALDLSPVPIQELYSAK